MILKKMFLLTALVVLLFAGCSDEKETTNELNKQGEEKEIILKVRSDVIDPKPKEPETHGCLRGCRGLPCDETARCVKRNCPSVNVTCEDGEHEVFKDEEKVLTVKPHKKILCQKGCDDVPKNSVEYENCVKRNCPSAKFMQE